MGPILLVEQNTRLALRYSSRAYVLRTGEIAKTGPSKALADAPEIPPIADAIPGFNALN